MNKKEEALNWLEKNKGIAKGKKILSKSERNETIKQFIKNRKNNKIVQKWDLE